MNSLIHKLFTAGTKNCFNTCGKSNHRLFVSLLFTLLISFQAFATSDNNFDLNVVCSPHPATCGENNGAVTTTVSGGVSPYTYMWSNGQSSTGIVNLAPGNYSVTVIDAIGNTATCSETVIGYPGITISSVIVIEATCGNNEGFAIVNVVGGPAGYVFNWSSNVIYSNGPRADSLSSGAYSVTITNPSQPGDCSLEETFTVGNVNGPETTLVTTASVCGEDNGSATFGEPNYNYTWSPDLGIPNTEGNIRTDLPAGIYFVTITDPLNPGCDNVKTVVIDEIPSITAGYIINMLPDCGLSNGSVTITANGGSGNYSYSWGAATVNSLSAGVYEVTVTDVVTGCTGSVIFSLSDSSGGATVEVNGIIINCAGDMDGTVNYTVTYGPGFAFPADTIIKDANGNEYINGSLSPGSYCIVITDVNSCFSGGDCFEIEAPTQIDADLAIIDATCTELGSITVELTGGAGGYTYAWNPPQIPSGPVANNLTAGVYGLTITDANGCSASTNSLVVDDNCPPSPPCNLSITSVVVIESSCGNSDGIAIVNVAGDSSGIIYNYTWSSNVGNSLNNKAFNLSAGTYSVTIENPADTCSLIETFTVGNIDGPESDYVVTPSVCGVNDGTVTFSNQSFNYAWNPDLGTVVSNYERIDLPGGDYFITITDPNNPGCEDVITVVVEEVSPLNINPLVVNSPDCGIANGTVTLNVLGGSGNYSFSWGGPTVTNLEAGVYQVTVTDNNTGCIGVTTFSLSANNPQATLTINSIDSLLCSGDLNGSADFTVNYNPGFAFPADTSIVDALGNEYTNGNLPAGSYCVLITDANGCQQAGDCFEIENPDQIDVDISIYPVECDSFGLISLTITGGVAPYEVLLDGQPIPPGLTIDDLDPGTYILTVTDANGCNVGAAALFVGDNCPPLPCDSVIVDGLLIINASCGNADGWAFISIDGGPTGFTYTWSPNVTNSVGPFAYDLAAGTYSVTVAYENNPDSCFVVETFTVGNVDGPEATYESTPTECGQANGTVTFSNQNYVYSWNPDIGTVVSNYERIDLPAGEYYITITDPNDPDCPDVITVVVEELDVLTVTATVNQLPDCALANGSVTINVSGGSGDYTYSWGGPTVTNLEAGIYEVTVTDNNTGCQGVVLFSLTNSDPQAIITINSVTELLCPGDEDGTVDYSVQYSGSFEFPATIEIVDQFGNVYQNGFLGPGTFFINVYDASGCLEASESFTIEAPTQINVVVEITDATCDSLGSISLVDVNGGAGGYTFVWDPPVSTDSIATGLEPGIYGITVTDANGCSISGDLPVEADTNAVNIAINYDSIVCRGSELVITTTNLDTSDILMFSWGPDSLIVIDGNENTGSPTINTETAGDYTIFYDITNQYGCPATDTLEIMVVDSLVADTIVSTMQCDSLTVDFSVNESPFVTYVWNFGDPGNPGGAIGPNPSHEYSDTGCFIVTLILLPNTGITCFQQDTILYEVCVVAPPLFNLGIDVSIDCNDGGAEVTLEDISTSPLGDIIGWVWTVDTSIYNENIVIIDVSQTDTLEVEMIVLNDEGCSDTLIQAIPINIIDITFPDIQACDDDFIQIYSGPDSTLVFEWSPSDIFDNPNDPYAIAHITENVVITVAISDSTNLNSCPQSDTIEVIVAEPINLVVVVPQGDSIYCDLEDFPTSITASCDNCDTNLIEWSYQGNIVGMGPQYPDVPSNPLNPGIYYVQLTDIITGCSEMDSVMLTLDLIALDAPPDPTEICFGDTAIISVSPPLDSVGWIWEGDNIILTGNPNEILVYPTEGQYFVYTVTNENGCIASDSAFIDVVNIGEVTATAVPMEICIGQNTQLDVTLIPDATYIWSNEETLNDPTINNPVATPLETTTYEVLVTEDESGCAVASSVTVTVVQTACEEPYVFFPNAFTPNGDGHNDVLFLRGANVTEVYFIIYNRWGEKMFESNSQNDGWDGTFNGKELGADVYGYYLKVRCGDGEEFIKKGNVTILK